MYLIGGDSVVGKALGEYWIMRIHISF